ncbi:cell division protein ZipA C-terminal FtsZ-binding domain-containing protein [Ramlibacter sp.]|uniref:cell division protein ZipA C-terminal FtsZ-binding domain-containing protein n=1 Tax=Ramlibacter sp. TaxID=1917967 RepID=UPI0017AB13FE|nr:cell division protein ZipA C-terminal FtsZ-binding domain-containing protein [Ramlibacter sp.]MBA2672682.1 cell division protein FtsZ [Ramlibacter sp.]
MTNFSAGIAMLGGLTLAGLIGYNAWSTRRNAPRQPEAPPVDPAPREQVEPSFDGDVEEDLATLPLPERKPGLDALIDVIAPITVDGHVSGEAAIAALPPTWRVGSKPFAVEGLNERTTQWEAPRPGEHYTAFQAGAQLANRNGALNDIEYSEYVVKAQAFADAISGEATFPEMLDEVARARELDQFASAHDAQLSFTLRARQAAWSPGYVHQNASKLGFVVGVIPGRMVLPSAHAGSPPLLGLAFDTQAALAEDPTQSAVREVTLSLDVPQVPRSEQPFVRMREAAIALAAAMDGQVTDDNGQLIAASALDVIGADLEGLYDTLDARDVAAGSPQARRLFS